MNERDATESEKFVGHFGAFILAISRQQLGMVAGPRNIDVLYERFVAAWSEIFPDTSVPEWKP